MIMAKFFKELWLILSGFGIMFAVLSWMQEMDVISGDGITWQKGTAALVFGFFLYLIVASNMEES